MGNLPIFAPNPFGLMTSRLLLLLLLLTKLPLSGCQEKQRQAAYHPPQHPVFVQLSAGQTGLTLLNALPAPGTLPLDTAAFRRSPEGFLLRLARWHQRGGGVAVADLNADDLPDLALSTATGRLVLFLNKGQFKFEDVTARVGLPDSLGPLAGLTFADVNADGLPDLYVCGAAHPAASVRNYLFINKKENGVISFREEAPAYGLAAPGGSLQACFLDFDLDGLLDCLLVGDVGPPALPARSGATRLLLGRKKSSRLFFQEQKNALSPAPATGLTVADFNADHRPDVFLAGGEERPGRLWLNGPAGQFQPSRSFPEITGLYGADAALLPGASAPVLLAAARQPADPIRSRTAYSPQPNLLAWPQAGGQVQQAFLRNAAATDWSWAALWADYNLDGLPDALMTTGSRYDVTDADWLATLPQHPYLPLDSLYKTAPAASVSDVLLQGKADGTFTEKGTALGLGQPGISTAAAWADFDADGDPDLLVLRPDATPLLYRNDRATGRHSLTLRLRGLPANTAAYGAEVHLWQQGRRQQVLYQPVRGHLGSSLPALTFGVESGPVDSVVVLWPGFRRQKVSNISSGKVLTFSEEEAVLSAAIPGKQMPAGWLPEASGPLPDEPLTALWEMPLSGPPLVAADFNADGLPDVFVARSEASPATIWWGQAEGHFRPEPQPLLGGGAGLPQAAVGLDADADGDTDLLMASASPVATDSCRMQLFLNEAGRLVPAPQRLPDLSVSAATLAVADVDADGFYDVFVGGRNVPGAYGQVPRSYFLRNRKGFFVQETPEVMQKIGMVTAALWHDFDGDRRPDLAVAGVWMPIMIFYNRSGQFTYSHTQALERSQGLWQSLAVSDYDDDGRPDLIAGNLGLNTPYRASVRYPLSLGCWENKATGTSLPLLLETAPDGRQYLLQAKASLQALGWAVGQTAARLAESPLSELLTAGQRRSLNERRAVELRNGVWLSKGQGNFVWKPFQLPLQQGSLLVWEGQMAGLGLRKRMLWLPAAGGPALAFSPFLRSVTMPGSGRRSGVDRRGQFWLFSNKTK